VPLVETVIVITGAARGIGRALAEACLDAGARVVLNDVDEPALEATVDGLGTTAAVAMPADVSSLAAMHRLAQATEQQVGPIDVWINNAGLARHRPIVEYTEAEIDRMLAVNLKGTIAGSQAALAVMASRRRGHIVNILSTAALRGIPTETVYSAAKWGARGFTQGLREEAAPLDIRVTAVLPGGVDTDFWAAAAPDRRMPVDRFLSPTQVAAAVCALLQLDAHVVPQELVLRGMRDYDFAS
jgi:NAD(P)-dependent dehydrogenase (short-subunit alcohol dehydrogenase family)